MIFNQLAEPTLKKATISPSRVQKSLEQIDRIHDEPKSGDCTYQRD